MLLNRLNSKAVFGRNTVMQLLLIIASLLCDSTFCIVDSEATCCSVTVYNIVQGWGVKIGDSIAIPEPFLQRVNVQHQDQVHYSMLLLMMVIIMIVVMILCRSAWVGRSRPCVCVSVCLSVCLFVCSEHNTHKRKIPKCPNLVYGMTRSVMVWG